MNRVENTEVYSSDLPTLPLPRKFHSVGTSDVFPELTTILFPSHLSSQEIDARVFFLFMK